MTVRLPGSTHSDNKSSRETWVRSVHDALGGIVSQISAFLPLTGGTLTGDLIVPDEVYGVGWNGSLEVPTKNAVYDKIETLGGSGATVTGTPVNGNLTKFSGAATITNGDLSGDVSTSGTLVTAIGAGKVTLAMQANMATASVVYRKTAGAGAPEVQTLATLKTDLGLTGTNSGDQTITLTSDVTGTGTGSFATTIASNAVTYAKMQDVSATSRVVGRKTAGSGDPEECTLSEVLDFVGSAAQGDILYRGAATWTRLGAGTSGQHLQTAGAAANPAWSTPARVLITETTTSASATNVSFTSIPATYRDLEIRIRGRGTKVATLVDIRLRFNGDTGANYDTETQQANNATNTNFAGAAATSGYIGNVAAASATANVADFIQVFVADYRGTTFQKAAQYIATLKTGTAAANLFNEVGSVWWRSTSAVTQIDVFPSGNAFVDGTVVSLYGLM